MVSSVHATAAASSSMPAACNVVCAAVPHPYTRVVLLVCRKETCYCTFQGTTNQHCQHFCARTSCRTQPSRLRAQRHGFIIQRSSCATVGSCRQSAQQLLQVQHRGNTQCCIQRPMTAATRLLFRRHTQTTSSRWVQVTRQLQQQRVVRQASQHGMTCHALLSMTTT